MGLKKFVVCIGGFNTGSTLLKKAEYPYISLSRSRTAWNSLLAFKPGLVWKQRLKPKVLLTGFVLRACLLVN